MTRRRLAFVYHPQSWPTMEVADAAKDVCDLIWVIDTRMPEVASMARLLCRLGTVVDVTDLSFDEAAAAIAEARPDGILALADSRIAWTAQVADRLGLRFATRETAGRLTDKHLQRQALRAGGLAVPGFWPVPADDDAAGWEALADDAVFPAVVKPRHSEGSRNTQRVGSLGELRTIVADRATMFDAAQSALVLEQYIPDRPGREGERFADYVSVESFVSDGQVNHLAVNGRFPPADPFRETGFFIPSALDDAASAAVLAVVDAAVAALGVTVGFLHTEIKMTPDGPCVIEVNGRIGGGVPLMLRDATGIEAMPIAFRLALGETVALDAPPRASRIAYLFLIQAPAAMRRILALDGLDALRADPGVDEVIVNRGPGMEVDRLEGNLGNVFSVTGTVDDHDQLAELFARATTGVHIGGA